MKQRKAKSKSYPKMGEVEPLLKHFVRNEFGQLSHPLFNENHYREQLSPYSEYSDEPLQEFIAEGERAETSPHPIYDRGYLIKQAVSEFGSNIANAPDFSCFAYCLLTHASPTPLFSPDIYLNALKAAQNDLPPAGQNPICHFLKHWVENRCAFSEYFSPSYYFLNNQHLVEGAINPLSHYFFTELSQRADANHFFHAKYYKNKYQIADEDPLIHFIREGYLEGNLPNPYAQQEIGNATNGAAAEFLNYIKV